MKLCRHCWEAEDKHPVEYVANHNCKCPGSYVDIDDNIAEAIRLLNIKGYTTWFCCEGHVKKEVLEFRGIPDMYIKFAPGIYDKLIKQYTLGEGWNFVRNSGVLSYSSKEYDKYRIYNGKTAILRKSRNQPITDKVLKECKDFMESKRKELYSWVLSLENINKNDMFVRNGGGY